MAYGTEIMVAAAIIGAAASTYAAYSAYEQQEETSEAIRAQKKVDAENARQSAAFEEQQSRRATALLLGKQRAIAAASGTVPTSGSPLVQEVDFIQQAELEALNIRRYGRMNASARDFEAGIARYQRDRARAGMPIALAGEVAGGISNVMSTYRAARPAAPRRSVLSDWVRSGYGGATY